MSGNRPGKRGGGGDAGRSADDYSRAKEDAACDVPQMFAAEAQRLEVAAREDAAFEDVEDAVFREYAYACARMGNLGRTEQIAVSVRRSEHERDMACLRLPVRRHEVETM